MNQKKPLLPEKPIVNLKKDTIFNKDGLFYFGLLQASTNLDSCKTTKSISIIFPQ